MGTKELGRKKQEALNKIERAGGDADPPRRAGATLREGTLGEFRWNSRKAEWSARRVFIELEARSGAARKGWPPAAERLVTHPPPTPHRFRLAGIYTYKDCSICTYKSMLSATD